MFRCTCPEGSGHQRPPMAHPRSPLGSRCQALDAWADVGLGMDVWGCESLKQCESHGCAWLHREKGCQGTKNEWSWDLMFLIQCSFEQNDTEQKRAEWEFGWRDWEKRNFRRQRVGHLTWGLPQSWGVAKVQRVSCFSSALSGKRCVPSLAMGKPNSTSVEGINSITSWVLILYSQVGGTQRSRKQWLTTIQKMKYCQPVWSPSRPMKLSQVSSHWGTISSLSAARQRLLLALGSEVQDLCVWQTEQMSLCWPSAAFYITQRIAQSSSLHSLCSLPVIPHPIHQDIGSDQSWHTASWEKCIKLNTNWKLWCVCVLGLYLFMSSLGPENQGRDEARRRFSQSQGPLPRHPGLSQEQRTQAWPLTSELEGIWEHPSKQEEGCTSHIAWLLNQIDLFSFKNW